MRCGAPSADVSFGDDRWIPIGLGAGPRCEVCGEPARWCRRTTVRNLDGVAIVARLWRCDPHVPAATAGRPPCRAHHTGPCITCRDLAAGDRLWTAEPSAIHTTRACP
jgi:hypothetical protein